jgi:hypothetical protein
MSQCVICNSAINPGRREVYQEVTGFVRKRKGGGANQIRRQKETGRWAHVECVERVAPLQIPGQLSII